jgi:DNA topoisomerase-1
MGRNGHFIACTGYPDCSFSSNYTRDEQGTIKIAEVKVDDSKVKDCEKCGKPMVRKEGKFGEFLACTGYPECRHTESVVTSGGGRETGVPCPVPGCTGSVIEKKSRRGKLFYGCNRYPECTFASWDRPVNRKCPDCGSPYLVEKESKREGIHVRCPEKGCLYREKSDTKDEA